MINKMNLSLRICIIFLTFSLFSMQEARSQAKNDKQQSYIKKTVMINTENLIRLSTDIYLPKSDGPFPCILARTPYNKINGLSEAELFTDLGYAVVIQDTRGKYESEGEFYPFKFERQDGLATIKWIKAQSWSNAKIGGWGGSYGGYTQWAIADKLDAIVPIVTSANMYELVYPEGIFSLATSFNWGLPVFSKTTNEISAEKIKASYTILPLSVADDSTHSQNNFLDDVLEHQYEDAYWGVMNHRSAESCPMYSIAGWYDIFLMSQINDFTSLSKERHSDSRMIIGPYAHGSILIDTDFGDNADIYKYRDEALAFLASYLKEDKNISKKDDNVMPYTLFIEHRNQWYNSQDWPPKETKATPYYLDSRGTISYQEVNGNQIAEYIYDPETPYPSLGGTFLGTGVGPAYQNPNIERKDQLIFESEALNEDLVLLGPVDATIYASTDAPSTDFFVSLQEIRADGKIMNIQEGGKTIYTDINSNERIQQVDISLWATGYQINSGNKIRVTITSALFPRYNRNLNSGEAISIAADSRIAHQKVYLGEKYPSQIILPILNMK